MSIPSNDPSLVGRRVKYDDRSGRIIAITETGARYRVMFDEGGTARILANDLEFTHEEEGTKVRVILVDDHDQSRYAVGNIGVIVRANIGFSDTDTVKGAYIVFPGKEAAYLYRHEFEVIDEGEPEFKVGDRVRILVDGHPWSRKGDLGTVYSAPDEDNNLQVTMDAPRDGLTHVWMNISTIELISEEPKVFEGDGARIRVIAPTHNSGYEVGDLGTITKKADGETTGAHIRLDKTPDLAAYMFRSEYEIIQDEAPAPKVGAAIRVVSIRDSTKNCYSYGIGDTGVITRIDNDGDIDVKWDMPRYANPEQEAERTTFLIRSEYEVIPSWKKN